MFLDQTPDARGHKAWRIFKTFLFEKVLQSVYRSKKQPDPPLHTIVETWGEQTKPSLLAWHKRLLKARDTASSLALQLKRVRHQNALTANLEQDYIPTVMPPIGVGSFGKMHPVLSCCRRTPPHATCAVLLSSHSSACHLSCLVVVALLRMPPVLYCRRRTPPHATCVVWSSWHSSACHLRKERKERVEQAERRKRPERVCRHAREWDMPTEHEIGRAGEP